MSEKTEPERFLFCLFPLRETGRDGPAPRGSEHDLNGRSAGNLFCGITMAFALGVVKQVCFRCGDCLGLRVAGGRE